MQQPSARQNQLVLDNMDLVTTLIEKLQIPDYEMDDAKGIATLGLVKAANLFIGTNNKEFRKYALPYMRQELKKAYPSKKLKIVKPSRAEMAQEQESRDVEHFDAIEARAQYEKIINYVLNYLDGSERFLLLGFLAGESPHTLCQYVEDYTEEQATKTCEDMIKDIRKNPEIMFVHLYEFYMSADYDAYRISFFPKEVSEFESSMTIYRELIKFPAMKIQKIENMVMMSFPSETRSTTAMMFLLKYIERRDFKFWKYPKQRFLDLM